MKNPKTFNEKLYWLKYYNKKYNKELLQNCYDKLIVRDYIKDKVGDKYLNMLHGAYKSVEDIDFGSLPQKYIFKISQSSGYNYIVTDNTTCNWSEIKALLTSWLDISKGVNCTDEDYLFNGNAVIICERLLETRDKKLPNDYRFFCFNGEPQFVCVDIDTIDEYDRKKKRYNRNTYDLDWNLISMNMGHPHNPDIILEKPINFEEMISVAKKLSEDFIFVRVDLYNVDGKIFFGELTWIPMGGNGIITPLEYEYTLGNMLKLRDVEV